MKKAVFILFLMCPLFFFAQEKAESNKKEELPKVITLKKVEKININPVKQLELLNKKGKDLITVKAYIRKLELKRKESEMC